MYCKISTLGSSARHLANSARIVEEEKFPRITEIVLKLQALTEELRFCTNRTRQTEHGPHIEGT